MTMTFYYGSGSPFSWYVWFVLEYKRLSYEFKLLSLQNGELKTPEYLAIHHRGKVPALSDHGRVFLESAAIVEYLEDRYPEISVMPATTEARAKTRQLIQELHGYLYPPLRHLMERTLMQPLGRPSADDNTLTEAAITDLRRELDYFENAIAGTFLCGEAITAADFALFPLLALVNRIREKRPQFSLSLALGPKTSALTHQVEQLPIFETTYPPHWREA